MHTLSIISGAVFNGVQLYITKKYIYIEEVSKVKEVSIINTFFIINKSKRVHSGCFFRLFF